MPEQTIYCPMDFRELPIKVNTVQLVMTDPMYGEKNLDDWAAVAEWAIEVLRPGGLFFAFTGTIFLPQVLERVGRYLDWVDLFYLQFCQPILAFHGRRHGILKYTKTAVLFSKGRFTSLKLVKNLLQVRYEKPYHPYQLPLKPVMYWMERFTARGDFVVDPMSGSWTVGIAARLLHRNFVGADKDIKCRKVWDDRLRNGD